MTGPTWLPDAFVAAMLAVVAYCACHPLVARSRHSALREDGDLLHVAMGLAMAAMLAGALDRGWSRALAACFAVSTGRLAWQRLRPGRRQGRDRRLGVEHASHLVTSAAMSYMLAVTSTAPSVQLRGAMAGMTGGGALRSPLVVLALAGVVLWYGASSASQLALSFVTGLRVPRVSAAATTCTCTPRVSLCCQVAMCGAMVYMVLVMA